MEPGIIKPVWQPNMWSVSGIPGSGKTTLITYLKKVDSLAFVAAEPVNKYRNFVTLSTGVINPLLFYYNDMPKNGSVFQLYVLDCMEEQLQSFVYNIAIKKKSDLPSNKQTNNLRPWVIDSGMFSAIVFTNYLYKKNLITYFAFEYIMAKVEKITANLCFSHKYGCSHLLFLDVPIEVALARLIQRGREEELQFEHMRNFLYDLRNEYNLHITYFEAQGGIVHRLNADEYDELTIAGKACNLIC